MPPPPSDGSVEHEKDSWLCLLRFDCVEALTQAHCFGGGLVGLSRGRLDEVAVAVGVAVVARNVHGLLH